ILPNLLLLLVLILLNGIFAMSEIAIVSSRRARLVQLAESGSAGARHALDLAAQPTRFLSSVQVGITSIGILSGAIGEASIARHLQAIFEQVPAIAAQAEAIALGIMVIVLTYVSLILGELVPKRIALTHPEAIATLIARPMEILATVGRPIVRILSVSTDAVLRLFRVRQVPQAGVTVEEIKVMLDQGAEEGVVEQGEREMVRNVLDLDDRHVGAVLTRRSDVVFVDLRDSQEANRIKLRANVHAVLPLCDGGLENVVGFVRTARLLEQAWNGQPLDLRPLAEPALFVPETTTLMGLLEQFKRTHLPLALVVDEFGGVEGLVSFTDVVSAIVGDLPRQADGELMVVRRDDGSWLMDGGLELDIVWRELEMSPAQLEDDHQHYHTLGGMTMMALGRVPRTGDVFERAGFRFEVVDMDGHRVDRVLVSRHTTQAPGSGRRSMA
ncbi:MAG: hemolysin family protein, partial [Vicinamibacterales bacterium]